MSEPDFGATQALKRASPAWAWIRQNVTPSAVFAVAGMALTVLAGGARLTLQIGQMQEQLAQLTTAVKASQAHDTELAVMRQHLQDVDRRLDEHQERWERIDQNIDLGPDPRHRIRKAFP